MTPTTLPLATTQRSCTGCPQLMTDSEQVLKVGKGIGGAVCAVKTLAIGRPGTDTLHHEKQAERCDKFGTPQTSVSANARALPISFTVALPIPTPNFPMNQDMVNSCGGCDHFISSIQVMRKTGWRAGMCAVKGELLLEDRLPVYAKDCPDRTRSTGSRPAIGIDSVVLLPEYREGYGKPDPLAQWRSFASGESDPRTYRTDRPVTELAEKNGVRAFRKIEDPKGFGPPVFLPVFDHTKFSKETQALIPKTGDEERPEWYLDHQGLVYRIAVFWRKLRQVPMLWGMPGVGKTEVYRHLAWQMVLPFHRFSIHGKSEVDDLAGKMLLGPEGTYFRYGRVPVAWRTPCVLCFDEPNTGPPEVWQFIRPLTDDSKQLVLDQNNAEIIPKHRACYMGMAANEAWDPRNIGAEPISDADGSRLLHVKVHLPPTWAEKEILKKHMESDKVPEQRANRWINQLIDVASEIRGLSDQGTIPVSWGLRPQIKVIRLKPYFSWHDAFRHGVADALEPEAARAVLDIVRNKCGES